MDAQQLHDFNNRYLNTNANNTIKGVQLNTFNNELIDFITSGGTDMSGYWTSGETISYVSGVTSGITVDHNTLAGLQGGTTNEYYHITNSDYLLVTGLTTTIPSLSSSISNEISDRISGDTGLSTSISTLSGATLWSSTDLSSVLSNGQVLMKSGGTLVGYTIQTGLTSYDASLSTAISNETSSRISFDNSLGSIATYDIWIGTQAAYDALGTYSSTTLYYITKNN
jgi:hypothetical protein